MCCFQQVAYRWKAWCSSDLRPPPPVCSADLSEENSWSVTPPSKFRSGPDDWTNKSASLNGVFVRHKRKLSLPLKVKLRSFQHTLSIWCSFYADDPWLLSHVSKTADGRIILYFYCTFNLNLICFWQKKTKKKKHSKKYNWSGFHVFFPSSSFVWKTKSTRI